MEDAQPLLPRARRRAAVLRRAVGLLGVSLSFVLLLLLVSWSAFRSEEEADLLDTHRQRMLMDLTGEDGALAVAKDWAYRHFGSHGTRRHASAYLHYRNPNQDRAVSAWYQTLVPKRSADDTYFAVEGNSFGYMGLQQVRGFPFFEGKVVFSLWDKGSAAQSDADLAQVVECGRRAICTRFGGEGTGVKSYINFYKWKLEKEYGFMTLAFDAGNGTVRYEGYLHAFELGGWNLLSKISVRRGFLPWHITDMYSFTEQWSPRDFGLARWAMLGPTYLQYDGQPEWTQVLTASFTHSGSGDEDVSNVNANVSDDGRRWGLGIGGDVSAGVQGVELRVVRADSLPEPINEFDMLVKQGQLPGGCPGGTCAGRWLKALVREAFSSSNLVRTCCIMLIVCILLGMCFYACHICCCECCCSCCCCCEEHHHEGDDEHHDPHHEEHWHEHEHGEPQSEEFKSQELKPGGGGDASRWSSQEQEQGKEPDAAGDDNGLGPGWSDQQAGSGVQPGGYPYGSHGANELRASP